MDRRNLPRGQQALLELQIQLEELQTSHEELRTQKEAMEAAAADLAAERLRYKRLFDLAPVAYLTTDVDGKILEANDAACDLLKISKQFIQSKLLTSLIPMPYRKPFRKHLLSMKNIDSEVETALYLQLRKEGAILPVSATAAPLRNAGDTVTEIRWLIRPSRPEETREPQEQMEAVSEVQFPALGEVQTVKVVSVDASRRVEEELQAFQLYAQAHAQLWEFKDSQEVMDYLSQKAAELVGNHCFLSVLTTDGKQLFPAAAGSRGKMSDAVLKQFKLAKAQPVPGNIAEEVLTSQKPCLIAMVPNGEPGMEDVLFKQGAVNMLLVPIRTGESSIGLLTLLRDQSDPVYNKQDLTLLQNLADYAGVILMNYKLRSSALEEGGSGWKHGSFMFAVCSDLQGPMHAISGYAGMLQEQAQELSLPELAEDAEKITEAATHVNQMLTQLFALSRIESGSSVLKIDRLSASELMVDVETEVRRSLSIPDFAVKQDEGLNMVHVKTDSAWARLAVIGAVKVAHEICARCTAYSYCHDQYLWVSITCEKTTDLFLFDAPMYDAQTHIPLNDIYCVRDSDNSAVRLGIMLAQRVCQLLNAEFVVEVKGEKDVVIRVGFSLVR